VVSIVAGEEHTCVLDSNGAVLCWGANDRGQLGDGTTTDTSPPVAVSGLSAGVVAIGAGYRHTCAILNSGATRCWGHNNHGQLGNNTTTDSSVPVDVSGLPAATAVVGGIEHSCALLANGSVECWGRNDKGQLGDGTGNDSATHVTVNGLPFGAWTLAAGERHTCTINVFGVAHCWGQNNKGQLGDGTTSDSGTPVQLVSLSDTLAPGAGKEFTCALRQNNNISCWGSNSRGQLGDGTTNDSPTPVDVIGF
jgi:alpha-tubulin suppressor-like RCC1 family protein